MLPDPIVPLSDVALIDERCVAAGLDLAILMERAGAAVATEAKRMAPDGAILVACGSGNNGGDGYVAARLLAESGREVWIWPVQQARSELCIAQANRLPEGIRRLHTVPEQRPMLIIDAILGAGVSGPLRDNVTQALTVLADLHTPCLAVDVPSGHGTDLALPRTFTVTFQVAKQELLERDRGGTFTVVDIGIPLTATTEIGANCLRHFPRHASGAHKGQNGEALVVGGGPFPGAMNFACRCASIAGCDLVHAWTAGTVDLPPTITRQVQAGAHLIPADTELLSSRLLRAGAVLIGPGAGRNPTIDEALRQIFSLADELAVPMVIDADGLTALGQVIRDHGPDGTPLLITPHSGELRALLGTEPDDKLIHQFARANRVVLAKGPVDLLSDGLRWQRNHTGNPRMAVGGTGDCLAGLAVGLLARGCLPYDAARMAVHWVCAAADRCWHRQGPCYTPEDIIAELPRYLHDALTELGMWPPVA